MADLQVLAYRMMHHQPQENQAAIYSEAMVDYVQMNLMLEHLEEKDHK